MATDHRPRPTHSDLVEAQKDIFRGADAERAMGIREETDEHGQRHARFYDLERRAHHFDRRGVWDKALALHEEERDGASGHPWIDWQSLPADSWWRARSERIDRRETGQQR